MVVRGTSDDGTRDDGPIIIIEHYFLMLYFQSDIQKKNLLKILKTAPLASPARATDGQMVPH